MQSECYSLETKESKQKNVIFLSFITSQPQLPSSPPSPFSPTLSQIHFSVSLQKRAGPPRDINQISKRSFLTCKKSCPGTNHWRSTIKNRSIAMLCLCGTRKTDLEKDNRYPSMCTQKPSHCWKRSGYGETHFLKYRKLKMEQMDKKPPCKPASNLNTGVIPKTLCWSVEGKHSNRESQTQLWIEPNCTQ